MLLDSYNSSGLCTRSLDSALFDKKSSYVKFAKDGR